MTLFKKIAKMDAHIARKAAKAREVEKKAYVKALGNDIMRAYNRGQKTIDIAGRTSDMHKIRGAVSALGFSENSVNYDFVRNVFVLTFRK